MAAGLMYLIDPLGQFRKANDAKRKSDLEQLQRTLEAYYNDNGKYPDSDATSTPKYQIKPLTGTVNWGNNWLAYSTILPKDPTSSIRNYVYYSPYGVVGTPDGQSYWLYASLEKSGDPQLCSPLDINGECPGIITNTITIKSCGPSSSPKPCNYGVSSPNASP